MKDAGIEYLTTLVVEDILKQNSLKTNEKDGLLSNYKKVLSEVEKQILVLKKRKPNNNHSLRERAKYE